MKKKKSGIQDQFYFSSYFAQFGKIESYTFLKRTPQRHSSAALITYGLSVDINSIIRHNQRMQFDGHSLCLRRTLPSTRPAFECFMSSNELLISLTDISTDEQFNEINIRKYFSKYGSIVSCRMVIRHTTYLIDFVDTNSVDCAILDEPHFYNKNELILRKYISPNRIGVFRSKKILMNQQNKKSRWSFFETIRRLKDITEAIQFGQKIELRLIKCSYEEKKFKFNRKQIDEMMKLIIQLRKKSNELNGNIQRIIENNNSLKLFMEQNQRIRKYVSDLYKVKIENEQKRINELKEAIDLLNLF
jgi:hypothetical protein